MEIKRSTDQLKSVKELFPIQRQILSDLCRGAQVVQCHDGNFRACIEIAGRSRLSAYALNSSAMTRLCVAVPQIDTGYCASPQKKDPSGKDSKDERDYLFHYIPAVRRIEVSDLLTLTIMPPREAFEEETHPAATAASVGSIEDGKDVVVAIPRSRPQQG